MIIIFWFEKETRWPKTNEVAQSRVHSISRCPGSAALLTISNWIGNRQGHGKGMETVNEKSFFQRM